MPIYFPVTESGDFYLCMASLSDYKLTKKDSGACTQGADKSLARPTSRCFLFDGENISFDASLVLYIYIYIYIYIYNTNIPPIVMINRIDEHQNLSL